MRSKYIQRYGVVSLPLYYLIFYIFLLSKHTTGELRDVVSQEGESSLSIETEDAIDYFTCKGSCNSSEVRSENLEAIVLDQGRKWNFEKVEKAWAPLQLISPNSKKLDPVTTVAENVFEGEKVLEEYFDGDSLSFDESEKGNITKLKHEETEKRELPVYLFQGQYLAEPRLNKFIDGAMDNLAREMKSSVLDPVFFRILPKGRIIGRPVPNQIPVIPVKSGNNRIRLQQRRRKRRPFNNAVRRRRRPAHNGRKSRFFGFGQLKSTTVLRRQAIANQAKRKRMKTVAAVTRGVGGGRIDGLSRVARDGDAEMQLFGNYTLIRSHFNMGPIELVMQFRTVRGIRRARATLERVKIHTVTRVNTQGCEMIDFLLDKPHPEIIEIRNQLFPLANRVAKNVFSRLFDSESFLTARIREKTGLALLSKKSSF